MSIGRSWWKFKKIDENCKVDQNEHGKELMKIKKNDENCKVGQNQHKKELKFKKI
jgi:hypothetical protein